MAPKPRAPLQHGGPVKSEELNRRTRPPERSSGQRRSPPSSCTMDSELTSSHPPRVYKAAATNLPFLNTIIWMIILLSQSTKANSVFLESCSSNNINQVFCHRDQLYVIQDSTLYYGNSCGQMMTNETIRVTKKFKTAVSMRTAFIDDKNSILLFSNNLVLTSSLDNRNVADLNNISQVILDYYGSIKYTVFEPTLKQVYLVDKDDKMYIFNTKIFSHTGSIKWGKEHSKFNLVDLTPYRFEYFFFAGPDLFAKHKGRNEYSYIKNFGYCLRDWKLNDLPDFEHCFNTYYISGRTIPLRVLVCTEIQYIIYAIFIVLMLLILLFCCLSCCYNYITDREKGGESYYVKENEDRFLKKLFKKYPKDKFDQFMRLYQRNEANPVKLDPNALESKDLEGGKENAAFQTELKYSPELKHPMQVDYQQTSAPMTSSPIEVKVRNLESPSYVLPAYVESPTKAPPRPEKKQVREPEIVPRALKPKEFRYATQIPVNQNNNLIYIDSNSNFERNFERASLILEDYAENKPEIDLREPRPYGKAEISPRPYTPYRTSLKTKEQIIRTYNQSNQLKEAYLKSNLTGYSNPMQSSYSSQEKSDYSAKQQQSNFSQQPFSYGQPIFDDPQQLPQQYHPNRPEERSGEFSFKSIVPNLLNLFSPLKRPEKDPKTKF